MKAATSVRQSNVFHLEQMIPNPGENPIRAQLLGAILLLQGYLKAAGFPAQVPRPPGAPFGGFVEEILPLFGFLSLIIFSA